LSFSCLLTIFCKRNCLFRAY